ncbi:MAG: hypothetical protein O2944_05760 [Proteobacteria bacterium]|nr:hypothetical protein [Pseudomonadota bacterium]
MLMDRIFATISMVLLVSFMGVVLWFVGRPALIVVTSVCLAMGIYDFYRDLKRGSSHFGKE